MNRLLVNTLDGGKIAVREYLRLMAIGELPVVHHVLINCDEITFDELINNHLEEEAIFFNDLKDDGYDDDAHCQILIDRFELILEEKK